VPHDCLALLRGVYPGYRISRYLLEKFGLVSRHGAAGFPRSIAAPDGSTLFLTIIPDQKTDVTVKSSLPRTFCSMLLTLKIVNGVERSEIPVTIVLN
jgi:hypothetical protein